MRTLAIGDIHGHSTALASLLREVVPGPRDRLVFLGDYIDRGPDSRAVIECLMRQRELGPTVFLRGNHEVMILEARTDPMKANLWQSYGGFDTLLSYAPAYRDDWVPLIPKSHWGFLENTTPALETANHLFVHASLDPDADLAEQPAWLLYWESFDRIRPHKSGKRIICGHTPQPGGQIKNRGFAVCIETTPWITCLDVDSGEYWQANERGQTRAGRIGF